MPFEVFLTNDAAGDLEQLYEYISEHDTPEKADHVLGKIEGAFSRLSDSPNQGAYPRELSALGIKEFREIFFKPYRIIYRVIDRKVYVMAIADGRREMRAVLEKRLLA